MKKVKQLFGKAISIIFAFVMILTAIPSDAVTVYAEETALTDIVEKAIASNVAKDLYSSSYTSGSTLTSGVYYLSDSKEFGDSEQKTGTNGLKIASGATVYLYIPAEVTLTAYGKNGNGTTGGYAGILVPEGSTLVLLGEGTVKAYGGNAGNGSKGGSGSDFTTSHISYDNDTVTIPSGGKGGAGGGGAGAGIGTNGGAGGAENGDGRNSSSQDGDGGASYNIDKDKSNGEEAASSQKGETGKKGKDALAVGEIYNIGVEIIAKGGDAGTAGKAGTAGACMNVVTEDYFYTKDGSDTLRGVAGGAGGGGGGAGSAGAGIGTGGGGGGQGGGGGSAGYTWTCYYIGGGGGGGGQGRNNDGNYTYGAGGSKGGTTKFTDHDDREDYMTIYASNGASDSTRAGGSGAKAYTTGSDGKAWGRGGAGGTGGQAGAAFEEATVQTQNAPTFPFTVTFEGAKTTEGLNVQNYSYGVANTIIVPEYDGNANTCFLGWEVKTYGKYVSGEGLLSETDVTIYQPGETIELDPGFSGSVVMVARTAALQGVSAITETIVIEAEEMEEEVSYYTYQVEAYLDNEIADVGNLELRDDSGSVYVIAYEDGIYSFITDEVTEFHLYRNDVDTGVKVTKDEVAVLELFTASVTTKLDGENSAEMGIVSLKGTGAPSLSTLPDSGIYTAINQLSGVDYEVYVDGVNTNYTVTYGEALVLHYYTTTLQVAGNLKPESVILVANDGSTKIELYEIAENKYSAMKLKHDLTYTMYIDGQKTSFTDLCFDQTNVLSVNYNKTVISTTVDGEVKEVGVVTLEQNQTIREEEGVHTSTDITYSDDSLEGTLHVNDREVGNVEFGSAPTISYYSVEYVSEHKLLGLLPTDATLYLTGDQVLLAPAVTSEDIAYQFIGWYVDGDLYQPGDVVTVTDKKVVVTAAWEDAEFDIRYELGLENAVNAPSNPDSYTIGGRDVVIQNPTADGYIFDGWTYDDVYEPQKDLVISADARHHYELVANWTPKTYVITADALDASEDLERMISLNFGTRISGYSGSLVPESHVITITNTGNQTLMLDELAFVGDGADYFTIGALDKTVLAPYESASFTVQPKGGLANGIYDDVIKVAFVSTEDATIASNSIMLTTRFEVGRDTTAPEVSVTVRDEDWEHVSDQFVFEPEEQYWQCYSNKPEITIDALDTESGVNTIEYYLANRPMTFEDNGGLESVRNWITYNENRKPTIADSSDGTYYLYVRVTDIDGNVTYVSTEGLVVDIIAPSIKFADGTTPEMYETYVGTQHVVVKDHHLVSVTLNGEELMVNPGSAFEFDIKPAMGREQEIVATDSFGHSKTIILVIRPKEYTVQFELNGGTGTVDDWTVYEAETNILPFLPSDCEPPYGKELAGWAIGSLDSDIVIAPGEEYEFTGHTTIYAIWKNAIYTIDYELDGGTNAAGNPATFDKDTNTITLLDPFKEGYIFLGWTWEAGMGIGEGAQTEPVKGVTIEIGSVNDKCFVANWVRMTEVIDEMLGNIPDLEEVTTDDKDSIEDALEIIDDLLSDENVGNLTPEEKAEVEEKKAALEEMLEDIEKAEERMEKVDETLNNLPDADEVTSEDKEDIKDALKTIDELLSDENKGNLTEEQQKAIENQKSELEEMLENIEKAEERMEKVDETLNNLPDANEVTSEDKEDIKDALKTIDELLSDDNVGNLTPEQQKEVEDQKAALEEMLDNIETAEERMDKVEETVNNLPDADEVTSEDKESIEEALDTIDELLSDENKGNLTPEQQKTVEDQKAELEEKLESIENAEERMEKVDETFNNLPDANEVTSEDQEDIKEALEVIDELLSDENKGNLTEEEQKEIENQKSELEEMLENIEKAEERMEKVDEALNNLPDANEVTSEDKEDIKEALKTIEELLSDDNVGNLTPEQQKEVEDQKADLEEMLENIETAEERMDQVEETVNNLPDADEVTSEDKESIEEALDTIDELLSDENKGNLTPEQQKMVEDQKAELEEKLESIEKAEERMEKVDETLNNLPDANEVTSEDQEDIKEALEVIDELLKDENVGNLTSDEKKEIEDQKSELEEMLENIEKAKERMDEVDEALNNLPDANEVTSEDKEDVKDALEVVEDLLSEENIGNLTPEQKKEVEKQKAALDEMLDNIETAEERMDKVEETVNNLPEDDKLTSDSKEGIEEALEIIDELLSDENVGNITENQKKTVENQKAILEEKLKNILAVEEDFEAVEDAVDALPEEDKVTGEDKEAIEEILENIEEILSEENVGNLTPDEKAAMEAQRADLMEMLEVIQKVKDAVAELQDKKDDIPSKAVITTESKEDVLKLLDIINDLQENHPNNMTEEQREIVESLKEELEEKNARIREIETSLNDIETGSNAQPDYKDITSDNKEDIKDIIQDIDKVLEQDKENLSEEEKKALEEQKKELEDKVIFIEKIEKYEPVAGDFENVTEPEVNDNRGNLENESKELIDIIPLEKTEKEHVAKGESVKVYLEVTDITTTVTEEDKELIANEIKDKEVAVYLDLTLFKQIGDREPKKVPNTKGSVTIAFQVPEELKNQDASISRTYKVVRVHEGETTIIDAVYNEATGEISFETDRFSTYALIYEDVEVSVPDTGDSHCTYAYVLMMIFGLGICFLGKKKLYS